MGDFEKVKESTSLKEYADAHLERVGGGYVCPLCKSGTGPNKSPAFSIKGETWKCFSCDAGGDVFDLAGAVHGTEDKHEQLQIVADWAGIALEGNSGGYKQPQAARRKQAAPDYTQGRIDAAAYLVNMRANLDNPDAVSYLKGRGVSLEQARAWGFGYDPNAGGAKDELGKWCRRGRIVMPWKGAPWYYIARSIDPGAKDGKYKKPKTDDVGPQPVYNAGAMKGNLLFIVEGVLDALAVEACGYQAIALGGTAYRPTLTALTSFGYRGIAVFMLDGDEEGKKAQEKALEQVQGREFFSYGADVKALTGAKDAMEALAKDAENLAGALEYFAEQAEQARAQDAQEAQDESADAGGDVNPAQVAAAIFARYGEEQPTPTGFPDLDAAINGGLRCGLTILGAVASAGKTSLLAQVCDYVAAHGRPCLFVSCEQSAKELVAKSLSRMMAARGFKDVTLWEMTGKYRDAWPDEKNAALLDAVERYSDDIAPMVSILEAEAAPTVADIAEKAAALEARTGKAPVVFVDFLQLLAPANDRATDKQAVDANLSELRRLSRRMPVVAISSLNRSSYTGAIAMDSFKESGGVEYSADILLGLQPRNMDKRVNAETKKGTLPTQAQKEYRGNLIIDEFRRQAVKECEITILKNRNGRLPDKPIPYTFRGASSLFAEGH